MSTIKSSDEHLTLNADGSSKDIKFQANGVEKASISSSGAFTSTTIDATALTGNLPAISAASLTNIPAANITGTLPAIDGSNLTGVGVAGITSSADATAITINSSEQVGIGTGSPTSPLHVLASSAGQTVAKFESNQAGAVAVEIDADADRDSFFRFQEAGTTRWDFFAQGSSGTNELNIRNQSGTNLIQFKQDGRGLSQFTAKAWCRFVNATINDSHNCSSITQSGYSGYYQINFTNNMANTNYAVAGMAHADRMLSYHSAPAVGSVYLYSYNSGGSMENGDYQSIVVFGD